MSDKKLKRYVFYAGNSNAGVAGVVIAVRAYNRRSAVRLANDFLRKCQYQPFEIEVAGPSEIQWACRGRLGSVLRWSQPQEA